MTDSWSPSPLLTTDQSARFYARQTARVQLLASIDPSLAQLPGGLTGVANLNIDANNLYGQIAAYKGAQTASLTRDQMESYSPGLQRSLFATTDTVTQQALAAAGYAPPRADPQGSSGLFGQVFDTLGSAAGDVLGAVHNAVGPVLDPALQLAGQFGQVPADMYRAIRTQPEWVQQLALVGAVAATVATSGATAPALFGEVGGAAAAAIPSGAAAIGGAFATAGIVNSLQGNNDFWGQAWRAPHAGERVWADHTLNSARDQIGTDGNLLELAKTMAYNDPLELAKAFGESNDSSEQNRLKTVEELSLRAGQMGTAPQASAYASLDKISADPSFRQAVTTLRDGKISFGRDIANLLGLDPGSAPYNVVSGAGDAYFQITTDPILAAGGVLKATRAVRFGVDTTLAADTSAVGNFNWQSAVEAKLKNPAVVNQNTQLAALMATDGGKSAAYRQFPAIRGLMGTLSAWKQAERPAADWSADLIGDFYKSQEGAIAFASGKALSARYGIIEIPHLNPISDVVAQLRNQFTQGINFLDDANISFKTNIGGPGVADDAYTTQAQMGGFTSPFVHFINGIPFVNKVAQSAATLAKTLVTKVPHDGFLTLTDQGVQGADMVNQARAFVDVMRVAGVPSALRDSAFDAFIGAANMGMRRQGIESFYRTVAEMSGLNTTVEGRDIMERFIDHTNQAYVGGRNQASFVQDAASLLAIPDVQQMRQAVAKQSILNKTLNAADAHWITAGVSGIWKPATLLRVGFIPRIVGDEMLGFIARHGITPMIQSSLGKLAVQPDDALARHVSWIDGLTGILTDGFEKATMGKIDASPVDQLMHSILLQYSRGIRHLANNGLMGLDNTTGLGKALAPPGTLRGLAFAGVDDAYRRRALDFLAPDGPMQAAWASRLSSRHNPILADINDVDPLRKGLKIGPDGQVEETVMINPGNSRQFLTDMSPEQQAIQANNQMQALRTKVESQMFDEWGVTRPGPYVTSALDQAGQSPEGLLQALSAHGASLNREERLAVSHLMVGANNSQPGVAKYLLNQAERVRNYAGQAETEEAANALMHRASQLEDMGHGVANAADRQGALDVFGDAVPPQLRLALGNGRMADSWLGRVLGNGSEVTDPLVRHENYQQARADLTEHFMQRAQTPEWQAQFNALDDANVTAITKTPVAHPPAQGTTRLWSPHLSDAGRTAMDDLVHSAGDLSTGNISHWLESKGVQVDDHTVEVITKWAQQEKRIGLGGTGWNPGAATAMAIEDPQVARNASTAIARAAGEAEGGVAELQSPVTGIGRFRVNHGVGGVSNPLRYGGVRGYAIDPRFTDRNAYQVFGPDFPHVNGVPGASMEQAIRESVEAQVNGVLELHAGPLRNHLEAGPATLRRDVWWNGPREGRVEAGPIEDRTSPIMIGDDGQVIVNPALANADLAAGLPYWKGQGELKQLTPLDTSRWNVPLPGRSVTMTDEAATVNTHGPWNDEVAQTLRQMAGTETSDAQRIIVNVNHRNARQASEWLDSFGTDYEFTTSGRIPKWAQDKLVGTQDVHDIPVVDAHLDEAAHATIDDNGDRIIRMDRDKIAQMKGMLLERSNNRKLGINLDATDAGITSSWVNHPSFNFMRPEDLYDALQKGRRSTLEDLESGVAYENVGQDFYKPYTFDDWVLAHEQGHHAMGHVRYREAGETHEEFTAGELARERQADRWAADKLGIDLPLTDPRSLRLQRAAARAGVDVPKLHLLMESTGSDAYKEMLGNLESARLAYGDNLQGDVAALRHIQANWDIPVTGNGQLKIPGADITDVPQPLWPMMAPTRIDELNKARGAVASAGDITGVPEELLPRRAIKTVYAQQNDPSMFHKLTGWGFDKVGGAIDKLFRQPAAMYYYQRARQFTDVLEHSLRDPALFGEEGTFRKVAADNLAADTRQTVEDMTRGQRADLVTAGNKMGMTAPTAQQVARTQNAGGVDWLHAQGEHGLADTLASTKPLTTVDEHMETLLDRVRHGDLDWVRESQLPTVKAALANADIQAETAKQLAVQRTVADMTPYIHDPRVRTQFQQHVNNIMPFWFAEDQFMRRWWRTMVYDPSVLRKAQLFHQGLKSSGLVQTDAQGNDTFVYPASAAFTEVLSKIPFLHDSVPITTTMGASLDSMIPGTQNFGLPSVTPFVTVPLNQIASVIPEMQPGVAAITGGFDRGIVRAVVPTQLMRFYDALGSKDTDTKMASAMMTAAAILEANGQGLPDNADAAQQETYLDRLRNHARTVLLAQAMWGFLVPAPPSPRAVASTQPLGLDVNFLNQPEQTLRPEYLSLVRNMGVEAGTKRFLELYPDTTPDDLVNRNIAYSKGQTARESGAPLPPTVAAEQFLNDNRTWMEQYRYAGPWLLPTPTNKDQAIDQTAYKDQMNVGFRRLQAPADFVTGLKFATGSDTYFTQIDQFKTLRDAAHTVNGRAQVDAAETLFKQQFYATHPLFAEQLQSSDGRARRAQVLNEMRLALTDPATPQSPMITGIGDMIHAWDSYQAFATQYAGRSGRFVDNAKKTAKNNLLAWMTDYVTQHPETGSFWAGVLKPEVGA